MVKPPIIAASAIAILAVGMFAMPIGIADAMGNFLDVKNTKVKTDSSEVEKAFFTTKGKIPTDGSGGAFGFGIISSAGLEAIAVTTTHRGIQDSVAQEDADDPVFHNHYVALRDNTSPDWTGLCDDDSLEIVDISFEEPGDVDVKNKKAIMEDVPYYFGGTHSLSGENIAFQADKNVGAAVSFTIGPVDSDGEPTLDPAAIIAGGSVCINDVELSDRLKVNEVRKTA